LIYFPLLARGDPIRMLCWYAKIDFEDRRISFEEFLPLKHNTSVLKSGQIPIWVEPNGAGVYNQMNAIV